MTDTQAAVRQAPARPSRTKAPPSPQAGSIKIETGKITRAHKGSDLISVSHSSSAGQQDGHVLYVRSRGVDDFVSRVCAADPLQIIETERRGVAGVFVKDLSKRMEISAQRMFVILGVPKATAEKKVAAGELLAGSGGRAALGLARLLGIAKGIVENSTAPEARDFDSARWLGQWLERPQPALGGRKPAELIDTPTGLELVARLLGAIESGAYQ